MIGQEVLRKELFSQSLQYSHKTILLLGEYGCGKHTLAKEYAEYLKLPLIDITEDISFELLETIQFSSLLSMYLIDLDKLTEQAQNVILKFIEEPSDSAYIILLSSNENRVIPTVLNRCYKCKFTAYTRDELCSIVGSNISPEILDVCTTPGQVRLVQTYYTKMQSVCKDMIARFSKVSISNALSISDKINYKDEYDKFDLDIFLKVLKNELYASYVSGNNQALKLYNIVCSEAQKLIDFRLNRELFVLHLLTVLWKESRHDL